MCILVVALNCHPALPFVCAHNRDEYRARPSQPDALEPRTRLVCGRDLQAGGTVLGVQADKGYFAALTNVRPDLGKQTAAMSRGLIVEHLASNGHVVATPFFQKHMHSLDAFHIVYGNIFGNAPHLCYSWKAPSDPEADIADWPSSHSELAAGEVFVISNENPTYSGPWPKSSWLREEVIAFLASLPSEPSIEVVHSGMIDLMSRYNEPGIDLPERLPKNWAPEREASFHTGPFAPWREEVQDFGTVSQRVIISDAKTEQVHYFHRCTNLDWKEEVSAPPSVGPWGSFTIPWSDSVQDSRAASGTHRTSAL